ncbi:hypothetical protein BCR32DRAFT_282568 [Anaeromyces robustus]|uniref:Uncharacterized protein n=1 Tax=Anaeromyces robustus TaxID=1754192 RepID=A0A1Y1WX75_9FUNG|nr:hypothetical protein BCR32DRAFT_282568 [Anaeromyces robustus]|eukprot:ORX78157.1 hypothetical protein BCR32DRAFT_282568 [Anaeromyces robustus]
MESIAFFYCYAHCKYIFSDSPQLISQNFNSFVSIYCIIKEFNIHPFSNKCALAENSNCITSSKEIMDFYWDRDMNSNKSIKAKMARCGYKIDTRVAKAAKMVNTSFPNCCSWYFHSDSYYRIDYWFINCFLFKNFRINYFFNLDRNFYYFLDNLFNSLYVTSDNSSVDNRINNIVKGYRSRDNIRINKPDFNEISNNCPYNKEWKCLYKCQIESGIYSKSPFLLQSAALLNNIMPVVCKRQYILFNKFKTNLSRNVNTDNIVGQPSRANDDPIIDSSGIG